MATRVETALNNPYNAVRVIYVCAPMPNFMGMHRIGTLRKITQGYRFTYTPHGQGVPKRFLLGLKAVCNETTDLKNWPFFAVRMPSLKRADVMKFAFETQLDTTNPMAVLAVFGATVIQNPYILVSKLSEDCDDSDC